MPKRRPVRTNKGQGRKLSKQQASLRAKKAWKTRYARYHYASEDEAFKAYLSETNQRAAAVKAARQQKQLKIPGLGDPQGQPTTPFGARKVGKSDKPSPGPLPKEPKGTPAQRRRARERAQEADKRARQASARQERLRRQAEERGVNINIAAQRLQEKHGISEEEAVNILAKRAQAKGVTSDQAAKEYLAEEPVKRGAKRQARRVSDEEQETAIFGRKGFGHERSIEDLIDEKREADIDFSDILEDPSLRSKLAAAGQEGDFSRFQEAILARELAEKRAASQAREARHGREQGWAGDYEFSPQETQLHNHVSHLINSKPKKRVTVGQMQDEVAESLRPLMKGARPHEVEELAGEIVSYKMMVQGTPQEAAGKLVLTKKTHRVGSRLAQQNELQRQNAMMAEFDREMRNIALRENQAVIKPSVIGSNARFLEPHNRLDLSKIPEGQRQQAVEDRQRMIYQNLKDQVNNPTDMAGRILELSRDPDPRNKFKISGNVSSQTGANAARDLTAESFETKALGRGRLPHDPLGKGTSGVDVRTARITDDELQSLAKRIANFHGDAKEEARIRDHLDSLKVRTAWEWDPTSIYDSPILKRGARLQPEGTPKPQRSTQSSEAFYKASGHEEGGLKPRGIRAQGKFIVQQQKNRIAAIKSGDYYMGYDSDGKPVSPDKSVFGITANKKWQYTTASGRKKDVEFADKRSDEALGLEGAQGHALARKFDDTVNIKLGSRKASPDYDEAWTSAAKLDKDIVVPMHSLKSSQTRVIERTKHVRDPETDTIDAKLERTRVRYMPWDQTTQTKGDADQIAVKIPGKGIIGERVIYANLGTDNEAMSNLSKYALGTSRARRERRQREMSERVAWMREAKIPTTQRKVTSWDNEGKATVKVRTVEEDINRTILRPARNLKKDVGGAALATAGLSMRKRIALAAKQRVNQTSKAAANNSPKYKKIMDSWSMKDYKLVDVKEGVVRPFGETVANYTYMAKHPLSSPAGLAHGVRVDTGYYREARFIHPTRVQARKMRKARVELERLATTEAQFEKWGRGDAAFHERLIASRLDPRKRDQEYRRWTRLEGKIDKLDSARREVLEGFGSDPGTSRRSKLAHKFAQKEAHKLQTTIELIEKKARPEWTNVGPVQKGFELVHLPGGGRGGGGGVPPVASGFGGFSRNQKYAMTGAGAVVVLGAGAYAYHRHKKRKEAAAGLPQKTFVNRVTPGPVKLPLPYARVVQKQRIGSHAITDELSLTGRKIPTRFGVGIEDKYLWKGSPADRGYDPSLPLLGGLGIKTPRAGKTTGKVFRDPNQQNRKRLRDRGTGVYLRGNRVLRMDIQSKNPVKLRTKNPNALSKTDRENLVNVFGLTETERSMHSSNYRAQEEARKVREFYTSGIADKAFLRKFDDPAEVQKIRRKKFDKRQNIRGDELIRIVDADGTVTWKRQNRRTKAQRNLDSEFSSGFDWSM